jgi:sterol desaturase/sphingolipid hydroxylase (fatty acid hydroxylase superfamily)
MKYQLYFPILDKSIPLVLGAFISMSIMERRSPLRLLKKNYFQRLLMNGLISFPTFVATRLILMPSVVGAAKLGSQKKMGILSLLPLSTPFNRVISFLLLDYFVYIWHFMAHNNKFLWQFHYLHHSDEDLTASTAIRFHIMETVLIGLFRASLILLIGASAPIVMLHEVIFRVAVSFHHSNWKLSSNVENFLSKIIMTPSMHGIHHSISKEECNSNYSTIFNFWDRIHRTFKYGIPQSQITIGPPQIR